MTFTLHFGMWMPLLAATVASVTWALWPRRNEKKSGDYDFMFWLPAAMRLAMSVIGSLVAWLVWALLR